MWNANNNKLERDWAFADFKQAMQFINKVAEIAERLQHHPDIILHDYKLVKVTTSTHDTGTITDKDWQLAKEIDKISI